MNRLPRGTGVQRSREEVGSGCSEAARVRSCTFLSSACCQLAGPNPPESGKIGEINLNRFLNFFRV